jgi:hypothetical protein
MVPTAISQTKQRGVYIERDQGEVGDGLQSKTKTAQFNAAVGKILAHSICWLIQSLFDLNIG